MKAFIVLGLSLVINSACVNIKQNHVVAETLEVKAFGTRRGDEIVFYRVSVGSPINPFRGKPEFSFRLGSGEVIRSNEINLPKVFQICTRTNSAGRDWGDEYLAYGVDGFDFIFRGQELSAVHAAYVLLPAGKVLEATLGNFTGSNFFALPIKKVEIESLFRTFKKIEYKTVL